MNNEDLIKIIEQEQYWQCFTCRKYHLEYNRFCSCGAEKQMEYRELSGLIDEFKEEIIKALRRSL